MKIVKKKHLMQQKQSKIFKKEKKKVKQLSQGSSKQFTKKVTKKKVLHSSEPGHVNGYSNAYEGNMNPLTSQLYECNLEKVENFPTVEEFTQQEIRCNDFAVHSVTCPMPEVSKMSDHNLDSPESDSPEEEYPFKPSAEQSFISEKLGEYQLYQIPQGVILLLHANSKLFIHGLMQFKILHGQVEVLGKILQESCPPAMVFSPRCSAYLYIRNTNINRLIDDETRKSIRKQLVVLGVDPQTSRDISIYKLKPKTVIAFCKNVLDKATEFLEENLPQSIYPMSKNNIRCTFKNYTSPNWNPLLINPEWDVMATQWKQSHHSTLNQIMLCGGKGVGKSSLLRYLVNSFLNVQKEVYVLDLDPGQPEFAVPGSISIVKVTSPLLGPNYTHLQEPEVTLFIPHIDISADHHRYISSVKKIAKYRPLIGIVLINYIGFTKGLGMYLAAAVINILKPQNVVQLVSNNKSKNFERDLTLDHVRRILCKNRVRIDDIAPYVHMKIASMTTGKNDNGWELGPKAVRDMCVLSYMSRILPKDCSYLTEKNVNIYRTSLDAITIIFNGRPCDPMVANGNLVALCKNKDEICIGWGIVRAIDKETNTLFLITPIAEKLSDVTHLVVGSVTLPSAIYLRHSKLIEGNKPYICQGEISHFGKTPKRSIYPKAS